MNLSPAFQPHVRVTCQPVLLSFQVPAVTSKSRQKEQMTSDCITPLSACVHVFVRVHNVEQHVVCTLELSWNLGIKSSKV